MATFDLRYEPWIPVLNLDDTSSDFGLYEILTRASEIKYISSNSPLEKVSLIRLLVGLMQHLVGDVADELEWRDIFTEGRFDENLIETYFTETDWSESFNLFDSVRPFWQIPGLKNIDTRTGEERPVSLISLDIPEATGNNKTLFSHRLDKDKKRYTPAEAARLLVTTQFFALGGLNKKTSNYLGYQQSYYNAAFVAGMPTCILGKDLFETICLNMIPAKQRTVGLPSTFQKIGKPPWAQPLPEDLKELKQAGKDVRITGFLEFFLPWSRYIRLIPESDSVNEEFVERVHIAQGIATDPLDEPWTAKTVDTKKGVKKVVSLHPEKALWRDFGALLGAASTDQNRSFIKPENLNMYTSYRKVHRSLQSWQTVAVMALANDKAKPLMWRCEVMRFPLHRIEDPLGKALIIKNLETAEETSRTLKFAIKLFYQELLRENPNASEKKKSSSKYANSSYAIRDYWADLELSFKEYLDRDLYDDSFIIRIFDSAERSLKAFFDQVVANDIRYYPAQIKANKVFEQALKKRKVALGDLIGGSSDGR